MFDNQESQMLKYNYPISYYDDDPNAGGTIIGTGNPLTSISITSTTDFYVRAEGSCDSSSTINQLSIGDDELSGIDLNVRDANREFSETAINERSLKELSDITNGYYFREEDLFQLPKIASIEPSKIKLRREANLWSSPLYLILLLIPITVEWFMRKFAELK